MRIKQLLAAGRHLFSSASIASVLQPPLSFFATETRAQIPTARLVARYDFNGNAVNSAPGSAPSVTVSGAALTSDRCGNANSAYAFNGISDFIIIPDSDEFSAPTTGSLSISVWVRPDGTSLT